MFVNERSSYQVVSETKGRYGHGHEREMKSIFCTSQMRKTITYFVWKWIKLPNVVVCEQGLLKTNLVKPNSILPVLVTAGYAAVKIGSFLS